MLNDLLVSVRKALLDQTSQETYARCIDRTPDHAPGFFSWIQDLRAVREFEHFFTEFAGQGRIRWHYGVAHPLLCSFEDSFMAERGRGWLDNANRARELVRTLGKCFHLFVSVIESQDMFREQDDPFHSQEQSCSLMVYLAESLLIPKCV